MKWKKKKKKRNPAPQRGSLNKNRGKFVRIVSYFVPPDIVLPLQYL